MEDRHPHGLGAEVLAEDVDVELEALLGGLGRGVPVGDDHAAEGVRGDERHEGDRIQGRAPEEGVDADGLPHVGLNVLGKGRQRGGRLVHHVAADRGLRRQGRRHSLGLRLVAEQSATAQRQGERHRGTSAGQPGPATEAPQSQRHLDPLLHDCAARPGLPAAGPARPAARHYSHSTGPIDSEGFQEIKPPGGSTRQRESARQAVARGPVRGRYAWTSTTPAAPL